MPEKTECESWRAPVHPSGLSGPPARRYGQSESASPCRGISQNGACRGLQRRPAAASEIIVRMEEHPPARLASIGQRGRRRHLRLAPDPVRDIGDQAQLGLLAGGNQRCADYCDFDELPSLNKAAALRRPIFFLSASLKLASSNQRAA